MTALKRRQRRGTAAAAAVAACTVAARCAQARRGRERERERERERGGNGTAGWGSLAAVAWQALSQTAYVYTSGRTRTGGAERRTEERDDGRAGPDELAWPRNGTRRAVHAVQCTGGTGGVARDCATLSRPRRGPLAGTGTRWGPPGRTRGPVYVGCEVAEGARAPRGREADARIEERAGGGGGRAQISGGMTGMPLVAAFQRPEPWSRERRSFVGAGEWAWTRCTAVASQVTTTSCTGPARPYPYGPPSRSVTVGRSRRLPAADVRATARAAPVGPARKCGASTRAAGLSASGP